MPERTQNRIAIVVAGRNVDRARAKAIFEETGFTVREAAGGPEALAYLRSQGRHAALVFIEWADGNGLAGIDLAVNLHAEFPWIHVVVATDDPTVFEELPCACVLPRPWRQIDLVVEAERVAHFGSTDELSQADAARLVSAHIAALDAAMRPSR
jgi:CheY-like chemotaxis protein